MAKKLLGSGPTGKGKHDTNQKLASTVGIHNVAAGEKPWVDPDKLRAANNAGGAGKMLHKQLYKDKSTGIKP